MTVCPVREHAERAVQLSRDYLVALRRLRRSLRRCRRCSYRPACPLLEVWNAQVDAAIAEINAEWEIGHG